MKSFARMLCRSFTPVMMGAGRSQKPRARAGCPALAAALLAVTSIFAIAEPRVRDPGFSVGEALQAHLRWGMLPVGTARISSEWTDDEPPLIRLKVHVRSNAFLDRIYRIDDTVESLVDPLSFLPLRFDKNMSEGGVKRRDATFFDRIDGRVIWQNLLAPERREYAAPREVRDILSLMYSLRAVPLREGETNRYVVAGDDGPVEVRIAIRARREYKHERYGSIPAFHIRPEVGRDGLFLGRVPRDLWISAHPPYVLLRLSVEAPIGQVHLLLDEIEGHPGGPWPYLPR